MNLPEDFKTLHNNILDDFRKFGIENFEDPKLPIYEDSLVRTIGKLINFPHRVNYFP
ncbi:hypothetical protein [Flavivirga jejuensis]|uniref:Uncharacterized protein n=1 Tax=Flavivirga jejuensis TaxID=870487 RepID=A0ABT8WV83_9FLAO|nr:hypothetical protein [Flavivirga jejuensis]MDO5977059.1 hypothetical protein [Flavivirga jejuensis]